MATAFYHHIPFLTILVLMLTGVLTSLVHNGRLAMRLNQGAVTLSLAATLFLLWQVWSSDERFLYQLGIVGHPYGNELACGVLEALLAAVFLAVMLCCVLGGAREIREDVQKEKQNLYFIMCDLIMASILAMIYTNDAFTAYVFIEINTISACALVMAKDTGPTLVATIRYLVMSLLGSGLFLMGLTFLYSITGHLLMPDLRLAVQALSQSGQYALPLVICMGMMTTGLLLKSALFPFHSWLPDAHGSATTTSSAILSGLVLKGYLLLLVKVMLSVFGLDVYVKYHVSDVLLVVGVLAMVICSLQAIRETHLKRIIAYSTAAQMGYVCLGFGLGTLAGIAAGVYQMLVHAVTKSLLFLSAGELSEHSGHRKQMYYLRGAGYRAPLAGVGFTAGALSMVGLPLLGGFAVKFYLLESSLTGSWQLPVVLLSLAVSSVLNALYYLPMVLQIWTPVKEGEQFPAYETKPTPRSFRLAALLLLAGCLALGICCAETGQTLLRGLELML